jgi:hypothetical protein
MRRQLAVALSTATSAMRSRGPEIICVPPASTSRGATSKPRQRHRVFASVPIDAQDPRGWQQLTQ